ncbi:glycosyltransferase family 2 protein [Glaciibacter sp. 2TAF33]|uniref:glycosyltransferase family 2 protein n=1 Tax=Glaciibacter sp. 2TAF33 TaxID=3233015 RepID=UPI003F901BDA
MTAIVLTKNEEAGIAETLGALHEFDQVIIVDSHSSDGTIEIAQANGAEVFQFTWDGKYPKKKQWSLDNVNAKHDWVLLLDADERPTTEFIVEIKARLDEMSDRRFAAYDILLSYRFAGRFLKHGHRVTKRSLLDRRQTRFPVIDDLDAPGIREVEGHYQPVAVGRVGAFRSRLLHDDRDPVQSWFDRHNRYSDWEAYLAQNKALKSDIASKRTTKGRVFDSVPFKPVAFFLYSYVARLGFLDGRSGLDYAIALSTYYWQISVKSRELARVGE